MQKILATKTASLTDLRDPMKVVRAMGEDRIAILNRDEVVAYMVPPTHIKEPMIVDADPQKVRNVVKEIKRTHGHILNYLKDK